MENKNASCVKDMHHDLLCSYLKKVCTLFNQFELSLHQVCQGQVQTFQDAHKSTEILRVD